MKDSRIVTLKISLAVGVMVAAIFGAAGWILKPSSGIAQSPLGNKYGICGNISADNGTNFPEAIDTTQLFPLAESAIKENSDSPGKYDPGDQISIGDCAFIAFYEKKDYFMSDSSDTLSYYVAVFKVNEDHTGWVLIDMPRIDLRYTEVWQHIKDHSVKLTDGRK